MLASPADAHLHGWAVREIAPWAVARRKGRAVLQALAAVNETRHCEVLYRFGEGRVELLPKRGPYPPRAHTYLRFFEDVQPFLPADFAATICVGVGDGCEVEDEPVFTFLKHAGSRCLLLPDLEFVEQDFYRAPEYHDAVPFEEKLPSAVFAGSTTGEHHTVASIAARSAPRIRAAAFFSGNPRVDFRLPHVVQCLDDEAEAQLAREPFCRKPRLSWAEQFRHRFILSMDGNGATCSRVALALMSNSVLLKYESPSLLYYFGGLEPWVHYVPIAADKDVDAILDWAERDIRPFALIAREGRRFAETYLAREPVLRYAASLLQEYARVFRI